MVEANNQQVMAPGAGAVREQLERILRSRVFRGSPRLSRFLAYTVEEALRGNQRVKEYDVAVAVFEKGEGFDPRFDSAVRVAARQLRAKLDQYYLTEGHRDPVVIRYRSGQYTPQFYTRQVEGWGGGGAWSWEGLAAVIAESDRAAIEVVCDCVNRHGGRVALVSDDPEKVLQSLERKEASLLYAGLLLGGGFTGGELARMARERHKAPAVILAAPNANGVLLAQAAAAGGAIIYKPLRAADVEAATRLADVQARGGAHGTEGAQERPGPEEFGPCELAV